MAKRRLREASNARIAESNAAPDVEIRIHGIGDHKDWSQLGSPELVVDGRELVVDGKHVLRAPDVALPPSEVGHELRLVNWSRTSRRSAGFLWYLALPYTLVNAARAMAPVPSKRHVWWAEATTGLVLTLTTYVWSVAIVETLARRCLPSPSTARWCGLSIALGVGLALIAAIVARHLRRPEARAPLPLLIGHISLLGVAIALTMVIRPAQLSTDKNVPELFFTDISTGHGVRHFWDPVTAASIAAVALVCLIVLIDVIIDVIVQRRWTPSGAANALTQFSSVILLVSVASAVRLFLDNGTAYLQNHLVLPHKYTGRTPPVHGRVLLSALDSDSVRHDDFVLDLLPILGIALALALVLMAFLCLLPDSFRVAVWVIPFLGRGHKADRARAIHRLITGAPARLPWIVFFAAIVWAALVFMALMLVELGQIRTWQVMVVAVQVLSGIVFLLVLLGRQLEKVAQVLGMLADLIGFWPVRAHPLAGASYRDGVVAGIITEVTKSRTGTIVVVGHSQGSILAAWAVRHLRPDAVAREKLVLVTCGSPLESLYAAFFPTYFDAAFFQAVTIRTSAWANFWRDTDPIATNMSDLGTDDCQIADQEPSGVPLGHGDYWVEPAQLGYIAAAIAAGPSSRQAPRPDDVRART